MMALPLKAMAPVSASAMPTACGDKRLSRANKPVTA